MCFKAIKWMSLMGCQPCDLQTFRDLAVEKVKFELSRKGYIGIRRAMLGVEKMGTKRSDNPLVKLRELVYLFQVQYFYRMFFSELCQ